MHYDFAQEIFVVKARNLTVIKTTFLPAALWLAAKLQTASFVCLRFPGGVCFVKYSSQAVMAHMNYTVLATASSWRRNIQPHRALSAARQQYNFLGATSKEVEQNQDFQIARRKVCQGKNLNKPNRLCDYHKLWHALWKCCAHAWMSLVGHARRPPRLWVREQFPSLIAKRVTSQVFAANLAQYTCARPIQTAH